MKLKNRFLKQQSQKFFQAKLISLSIVLVYSVYNLLLTWCGKEHFTMGRVLRCCAPVLAAPLLFM